MSSEFSFVGPDPGVQPGECGLTIRRRRSSPRLGESEALPGLRLIRAAGMRDGFRRHSHRSILVGVVLRGWRRFRTRHGEHLIEAGRGFVLPAQLAHTCEVSANHGYRVVSIASDLWRDVIGADGPAVLEILSAGTPALLALRRLIVALRGQPGALAVESCIVALQESLAPGCAGSAGDNSAPPERVRDVCEWLEAHCTEKVRLTTLTDIAGCSPGLINRSFSQVVGLPPYEYLMQLRLRLAARCLRESDASLSDVALDAGFSDQSHFQRFFRRAYGTTPHAYRESSFVLKRG